MRYRDNSGRTVTNALEEIEQAEETPGQDYADQRHYNTNTGRFSETGPEADERGRFKESPFRSGYYLLAASRSWNV